MVEYISTLTPLIVIGSIVFVLYVGVRLLIDKICDILNIR